MNSLWFLLPIWFLSLAVCWGGWIAYLALRTRARPGSWFKALGWATLTLAPVAAALAQPHLLPVPTVVALLTALHFMGMCMVEHALNVALRRGAGDSVKSTGCTEASLAGAAVSVPANGAPRTTAQPEQVRVSPGDEDFLTEAIASVMAFKSNSDVLEVHVRGLSQAELFRSEHAKFFYGDAHFLVEAAASKKASEVSRGVFEFADGSVLRIGTAAQGVHVLRQGS